MPTVIFKVKRHILDLVTFSNCKNIFNWFPKLAN